MKFLGDTIIIQLLIRSCQQQSLRLSVAVNLALWPLVPRNVERPIGGERIPVPNRAGFGRSSRLTYANHQYFDAVPKKAEARCRL